jgi:hypothetical protein
MPPFLESVSPNAGDPGDRFTATLGGDVFSHATQVSFGAGIQVEFFAIVDDGTIEAKIQIEKEATPGARDVAVADLSGVGKPLLGGFRIR